MLFGDTHYHTNLSFDAGLIGTSLTVHDGFRVARGEKVISNTGQPVQLIRPLDFLAITDPDFDSKESAFYYFRVLEIPTPRWTTYDAAFYGIDRPDTVPPTLQDRAYTSPIWYSP